jgi:hypothetical protein
VEFTFTAEVWYWRGPSPFYFVSIPKPHSDEIQDIKHHYSYGWGAIPAEITIGATHFTTSIFPKDGGYIVPLKKAIRAAESIDEGSGVTVTLSLVRE